MAGGHSRGGTTVTYGSHGGSGASRTVGLTYQPEIKTAAQAAQEAAIAQAQSNIARNNNQLINAYNAQNATPKVYIHSNDASIGNASPATLSQQPTSNGGGGGTYQMAAAPASDPYADLYAIYQQKLNAENAANEQRRQARANALQSNYANAKSKLSAAFNSGEASLNQDANKALREAFVQSKLNERALNQQLQSMGINGGALESSLARGYNDYANSRNAIEQNRMDALKDLLSQYQGQLGDMESAYAANLADLDSDYFGNGLDFVTDYYDAIAALQKQNAASNLQAQLGKRSSGSVSTSESNGLNKDIVNGLKNYKGNLAAARAYLTYKGIPEQSQNDYLMDGGFGADMMDDGSLASYGIAPQARKVDTSSVSPAVRQRLLSYLDADRGQVYNGDAQLMKALQDFGKQYNIPEDVMKAILAEAGY